MLHLPTIDIRIITCYTVIVIRSDNVKISELIKILKKNGCIKSHSGSRHDIWYSPITGKKFTVPRHGAKEIKTGTAESIFKDAGLK